MWSLSEECKKSLDILKKGDNPDFERKNDLVHTINSHIKSICNSLRVPTEEYSVEDTNQCLDKYFEVRKTFRRGLYSDITNFLFSLNELERGIFLANLDAWLEYSLKESSNTNNDSDSGKIRELKLEIIMRFYDHSQLAASQMNNWQSKVEQVLREINDWGIQIENAKSDVEDTKAKIEDTKAEIEDTKATIGQDMKRLEREYITILGIFASIVVVFMGGATFTSSVLQGIDSSSIYRLVLIVDFIAFVLINSIYLLAEFLIKINGNNISFFRLNNVNWIFLIIAIAVIASWIVSAHLIPTYVLHKNILPWLQR